MVRTISFRTIPDYRNKKGNVSDAHSCRAVDSQSTRRVRALMRTTISSSSSALPIHSWSTESEWVACSWSSMFCWGVVILLTLVCPRWSHNVTITLRAPIIIPLPGQCCATGMLLPPSMTNSFRYRYLFVFTRGYLYAYFMLRGTGPQLLLRFSVWRMGANTAS